MQQAFNNSFIRNAPLGENSLGNLLRQSMQLIARLPTIAAQTYAFNRSYYAEHFWNLLNGSSPQFIPTTKSLIRVYASM